MTLFPLFLLFPAPMLLAHLVPPCPSTALPLFPLTVTLKYTVIHSASESSASVLRGTRSRRLYVL